MTKRQLLKNQYALQQNKEIKQEIRNFNIFIFVHFYLNVL